jgi:hypothetical protein
MYRLRVDIAATFPSTSQCEFLEREIDCKAVIADCPFFFLFTPSVFPRTHPNKNLQTRLA